VSLRVSEKPNSNRRIAGRMTFFMFKDLGDEYL